MSLEAFFREQPDADEHALAEMLSGHLCRCTGYTTIIQAALHAQQRLREENMHV